jgi:N-acetyl-gamma-glutamylphosphate reductase
VVVQQAQQFNACIAMEGGGAFIEKGIKVIDLGADFRLNDKAEYQQWYNLDNLLLRSKFLMIDK